MIRARLELWEGRTHGVDTFDASIQIIVLRIFTDGFTVDEGRIERESRKRSSEFGPHFRMPGYFEEEATIRLRTVSRAVKFIFQDDVLRERARSSLGASEQQFSHLIDDVASRHDIAIIRSLAVVNEMLQQVVSRLIFVLGPARHDGFDGLGDRVSISSSTTFSNADTYRDHFARPVKCKVDPEQPESPLEVHELVPAAQTIEDGIGDFLPGLFVDTRLRRGIGSNGAEAASKCTLSHNFECDLVQILHQIRLERFLTRLSCLFGAAHPHIQNIAHWLLEQRVQPVNVANRERRRKQFLEVLVHGRPSANTAMSASCGTIVTSHPALTLHQTTQRSPSRVKSRST